MVTDPRITYLVCPRADLPTAALWERLLRLVLQDQTVDGETYGTLHGICCSGAALAPGPTRLLIQRGQADPETWRTCLGLLSQEQTKATVIALLTQAQAP